MQDKDKSKEELQRELDEIRQRLSQLERCEMEFSKAEEKYRNIYENATEGIFQTSLDGRFISANPSLARIHGYDSPADLIESITDMSHQLYVNPEDRSELIRLLNENGAVQNFEVQMYRKDRSLQWISINVKVVKDKNGKALFYEGTMQDITQRKLAETALIESEERYRTAIEHSNDGVAIVQGDKNQYVNKRFIEMFEYEKYDDIIGKSILITVHPDNLEMVKNINMKRQRGESVPSRYEFKGITRTGKIIYVEVSATITTYRGNTVYLINLRDVTERKKAEYALLTERNRFQALSDNAPFGIAMIDKAGAFRYINPKFIEIFGYNLNDVPDGKEWFKKAYPDTQYRKQVILTWINDIKNTKPGERMPRTFEVTCKDNTKKTINFIPVRLINGDYLISFEDITERILAHEALIKSHKELENLNRAKTKAVNHISHELKTPLSVIQGNIRILKRKLQGISSSMDFQGIIDALERNLERLFGISKETDEIFNVSRQLESMAILNDLDRIWHRAENIAEISPEIVGHWNAIKEWLSQFLSGSTQIFQPIDLFLFVQSIVEKTKQHSRHRRVDINLEGINDLFISIDPTVLREVIEGLIKNAIENTPDGGSIFINVEQKEDRIWLNVMDYGIGITEQNQQYLFDGLFHTKETELYTSKKPYDFGAGGKGLELLRIKTYAQRFGFNISFKSTRCIYIPTDQDICPGDISQCAFCKSFDDCKKSGASIFSVSFPVHLSNENLLSEPVEKPFK